MDFLEQVADGLAKEVLEAERLMDDEDLVNEIMKTIGASSTTLEEAFLTAVRIRRAETRARRLLVEKVKEFKENPPEPA
ncbi:MAG: hypothetical protein GY945_12635 [Rhodobacteraceae bacterium]|nr:hypothetical protein [Paracoccaceae bacterium]